jgi:hypothetical protein
MGVASRLLDEMLRIEPNYVRYLSRTDLDAFSLGEGPPGDDIETVASLKEAATIKIAAAYGLSRLEYNRRSALIDRTCKFDNYQSPFEPVDFGAYGRSVEELQMSKRELLAHDLETEEGLVSLLQDDHDPWSVTRKRPLPVVQMPFGRV